MRSSAFITEIAAFFKKVEKVAAISENTEGASLIWFTGAKSYLTPTLTAGSDEAKDEAYLSYIENNSICVMGTVVLLNVTYAPEVTIPEAKQFDISLMNVNSANFLYFNIVVGIIAVAVIVAGVIICYIRKKA